MTSTSCPCRTPPKVLVPGEVFRLVAENLKADEDAGAIHDHRLVHGVRPSEVKRAEPGDVTLTGGSGWSGRPRAASRGLSG